MTRAPRQLALYACFWLSGFAALLFQVAWTREFAFVFGTSELAIATVLAGFMGGLTGGAALAGRFASRIRRPILVYAALEGAIAVSALLVPYAIEASTSLVIALFGHQPELPSAGGAASGAFYIVSSLAILFIPTACMGATLPVLTRFAVERDDEIASRVGTLYAVNTAGSVVGALVAAFCLLPTLGLRGSVMAGACLNLTIFAVGVWLARQPGSSDTSATPSAAAPEAAANESVTGSPLILVLIAVSGMVSFSYEIMWARLLSHVLGGSVQSFATMLASFLTGIAIGSSIASRFARTPAQAATGFVLAQLGIAGLSTLCFALADGIPALAAALGASRDTPIAQILLGLAALLPAAICIGATLPFAVGVLARSAEGAASATARCYAWNTLGAIAGALGTGFLLLPALGFNGVLLLAVSINLGLAAVATRLPEISDDATRLRAVPLAIAAVFSFAVFVPSPERLLTTSPLQLSASPPQLLHHLVGRSASVAAVLTSSGEIEIRTNGLKEASLRRPGEPDSLAYAWLTGLAAALRPEARDLLVVGFGGGELLEDVPVLFDRIDVVEIEEKVLEANRLVAHLRAASPFADPRLRIATNDVRGALVLTERSFDAIVSQPSHPWTEGASHLYTREFFALAAEHLNDGGILVQWVGIDFLDAELFVSTLASLRSVFNYVEVYQPYPFAEIYFAASDAPIDWKRSGQRFIDESPADATRLGIFGIEDLLVALRLVDADTQQLSQGAAPITDARNAYQFRAGRKPEEVRAILDAHDPLSEDALEGLDLAYLKRRLGARGSRIAASAPSAPLPAVVSSAQQLALEQNWPELSKLDAALAEIGARDPNYAIAAQARVAWRLEGGDPNDAHEAAAMLDPLLLLVNSFDVYLWRARAFALSGSHSELVGALRHLVAQLARRRATLTEPAWRNLTAMAADLARYIPEDGEFAAERARLEAQLRTPHS